MKICSMPIGFDPFRKFRKTRIVQNLSPTRKTRSIFWVSSLCSLARWLSCAFLHR